MGKFLDEKDATLWTFICDPSTFIVKNFTNNNLLKVWLYLPKRFKPGGHNFGWDFQQSVLKRHSSLLSQSILYPSEVDKSCSKNINPEGSLSLEVKFFSFGQGNRLNRLFKWICHFKTLIWNSDAALLLDIFSVSTKADPDFSKVDWRQDAFKMSTFKDIQV